MNSVEQVILAGGTRGIERLARHLAPGYVERAARALRKSPRVLITTGFYVEGHAETDGPPGALFLGRALAELGAHVAFVGEPYVLDLLQALVAQLWRPSTAADDTMSSAEFVEFPVTDDNVARALSAEILAGVRPTGIVVIERCGRTRSGAYRNMLGMDIGQWTARVDDLLAGSAAVTVGVGDGGNEIGMGVLARQIPAELGILDPVETAVDHLVLAAVSNWGAYAIIAGLSRLCRRDLLPAEGEEGAALDLLVAQGAIDGLTRKTEPTVDGFSLEVSSALIAALRNGI